MQFLIFLLCCTMIVVAVSFDYLSTVFFLSHGVREANPFVRWLGTHVGLLTTKFIQALFLCGVMWGIAVRKNEPHEAYRYSLIIFVIYVIVATWNVIQGLRA